MGSGYTESIAAVNSGGELHLLARAGETISPDVAVPVFSSFTSVAASHGNLAVLAKIIGDGNRTSDPALIRQFAGEDREIVARVMSRPPLDYRGPHWASISSYALGGDHGTLAFVGKLRAGLSAGFEGAKVTAANDSGLYISLAGAAPRLILQEGDEIGDSTVRSFASLTAVSGSTAQRRSFSADGSKLLIRVVAKDGTQHLLHVALPSIQTTQ
jgi:hypothetical protein